ncbi:MAG: cell division protein FtsZ [Ignavibacteria bacterium]|nr:cell division protein FtsZ [Ignavibacteria bacterium]
MIELDTTFEAVTKIAVVGVGGAGCNTIQNLCNFGLDGVDLIAINTDAKQLKNINAQTKVIIGKTRTKGQGAGSNPELGKIAAEEDFQTIVDVLKGKDMIFIATGMGGGTGTGASPIVARAAKENDSLTVGVVLTPLKSEGPERWNNALIGIENIRKHLDGLLIVSNEKLSRLSKEQSLSFKKAFQLADRIVFDATKGIIDLINNVGEINVDFADVKAVIQGKGDALIGKGFGEGEQRSFLAVETALNSPLLEGVDLRNARSALVHVTCGEDFLLNELDIILNKIKEATNPNLHIIPGVVTHPEYSNSVSVTIIITGFNNSFIQDYLGDKKELGKKKVRLETDLKEEFLSIKSKEKIILNSADSFQTLQMKKNDGIDINDRNAPACYRKQLKQNIIGNVGTEPEKINQREPFFISNEEINSVSEDEIEENPNFPSRNNNSPTIIKKMMD